MKKFSFLLNIILLLLLFYAFNKIDSITTTLVKENITIIKQQNEEIKKLKIEQSVNRSQINRLIAHINGVGG
nr:MAG TPA: hypothetical protein [Caudoviricetes sp.]